MAMFLAGGTSLDQINHTLRLIQQHFNQQAGASAQPSVAATQGAFSITGGGATPGGTVTSVGLSMPLEFVVGGSPVVTAGTLSATWANEASHTIFAGPLGAVPGTPGFRILDQTDMPISVWSNRYKIPASETLTVPANTTLFGGATGLEIAGKLILDGQLVVHYGA